MKKLSKKDIAKFKPCDVTAITKFKKLKFKTPKDWFDKEQLFGTIKKDCVCIGNQIISRLSCLNRKGQYFIVEDPSGWAYLVWDLNTPGGPFHGKFKRPKK